MPTGRSMGERAKDRRQGGSEQIRQWQEGCCIGNSSTPVEPRLEARAGVPVKRIPRGRAGVVAGEYERIYSNANGEGVLFR